MNHRKVSPALAIIGVSLCMGGLLMSRPALAYANHLKRAYSKVRPKARPTFASDVAPIIFANCSSCHRPGQSAPFPLMNYSEIKARGQMIATVTESKLMPPWKPGPSDCELAGKRALTDDQVATIQRWVSAGMPKGPDSEEPPAPKFESGWRLGKPDLIVKMAKPFPVPADGPDVYRVFVLPLNLPKDTYIKAIDFQPGARTVVHHSLFYYDATGASRALDGKDGKPGFTSDMGIPPSAKNSFAEGGNKGIPKFGSLGGWAVGALANPLPDGLAFTVPKDADLLLSDHFHPSGKAEMEQSTVGIYFSKKPPTKDFTTLLFPPVFGALSNLDVPAGDKDWKLTDTYTLPVDMKAFGVTGHAHYLGKDMELSATLPDGTTKKIFSLPNWDFNWQEQYRFEHYVNLPKGTVMHASLSYDNSAGNPSNPNNPPKRVKWGEQTTDEMGSLVLWIVPNKDDDLAVLKKDYRGHIIDLYKHAKF